MRSSWLVKCFLVVHLDVGLGLKEYLYVDLYNTPSKKIEKYRKTIYHMIYTSLGRNVQRSPLVSEDPRSDFAAPWITAGRPLTSMIL